MFMSELTIASPTNRMRTTVDSMTTHLKWPQIALLGLSLTSLPAGLCAQAQTYPTGPVRIITQVGAGNSADTALRVVAGHLGKIWGQEAVVVNQSGAGGLIAARAAAAARPDGQTLFMALASTYVALPELQTNLPFDVNDFVPIGFVGEVPFAIAVSPQLSVSSLPELIRLSRRQPGGLSIAVPPRGELPHLAAELFRSSAGAELTAVHYPTMSQAMGDVISGRVATSMEGLGGPTTRGPLKVLAIASHKRLTSRPDVPTVSETVTGFAATGWWVLVAPPGTPTSITRKLSDQLHVVLSHPEIGQRFQELGSQTRQMSPQQVSEFIRGEQQLWKPVIKKLGLATK
jgi:tripartite-type tricarboxylate transporter receptor subunit TctC